MPDIGNIGSFAGPTSASIYSSTGVARTTNDPARTSAARAAGPEQSPDARRDTVQVSDVARYLATLRSMPPIRADKVAAIKAQIEAGTYDVDEKLAVALDRMIDENWSEIDGETRNDDAR